MTQPSELLSWQVGAPALAAVALLARATTGRRLGVSGAVEAAVTPPVVDGRTNIERRDGLLLVSGIVIGGFVAGGSLPTTQLDPVWASVVGGGASAIAASVVGGALVGFGTRLSGGCTSGHGLVGCALLRGRSLLATAAFFGTAIVTSLVIDVVTTGGAR